MRRTIWLLAMVVACGVGLARARTLRASFATASRLGLAFGTVSTLSATPGTISFHAVNPDSGSVSGSSQATISWQVLSGSHLQNWILSLQAGSASFDGCPVIPASAVLVSCSAVSVSGGGGTGGCSGSFPLSTSTQQVAAGTQGDNSNSYSVYLNFTLADSWRYIASSSCTITMTYSVNAQ